MISVRSCELRDVDLHDHKSVMKVYYDVTKARSSRHMSGLTRVSHRLLAELNLLAGIEVDPVVWSAHRGGLVGARGSRLSRLDSGEHYFTPELFSEKERPGFDQFLEDAPFRTTALYHDAIPLKFPEFTRPRSVLRHPVYMKSLASFDRVLAISGQSRQELQGYWHWLGIDKAPPIDRIALGADFLPNKPQRSPNRVKTQRQVLTVGIIEPRKNHILLLDTCERLWKGGHRFDLVIAGRTNPHFAKPILKRVRALKGEGYPVVYHKAVTDDALWDLYRSAHFSVFPSRFEGCGLPVQESLWAATPCLCADIPVLRECSREGGCLEFRDNDGASLYTEMKRLLDDDACHGRLREEISRRRLPTWHFAARQLVAALSAKEAGEPPQGG